jgi:nucleotide-binding universal stress UspA family protein
MTETQTFHHSILVPLDGSETSETALPVADALLQGKNNGSLTVLRALETPRLSAWLPAEMLPLHERERDLVQAYLEKKRQDLEGADYQVRTVMAPGPGPVDAVAEECSQGRVGLVVASSHGASGWIQSFLGSNTEKMLRTCDAHVLVVKNRKDAEPGFKKILIPLDGSKKAETAIPRALDIAPGGTAKITLVGVSVVFKGHAFEGDLKTFVEPDSKRISEYLESQAEWLSNQGYQVDVVVRRGDPAEEILDLASQEKSDLILMTSQGRTGFAAWRYGSVAERLLRHSKCSLLVLKEIDRNEG